MLWDGVDSVWSSRDLQKMKPPHLSPACLPWGPLASESPLCLEWASEAHRLIAACLLGGGGLCHVLLSTGPVC